MVGEHGTGPVKVRHLTSVHQIGDNRIFYREAKGLADAGYDVALVVGQAPHEPVAGVPVIGVGLPRNRVDRATRTVWKVFRAARAERAQIYHLHDPELLWAGLLLKLLGQRVVYDVHEDAPKQIMNKFWIPWWAKRVLSVGTALAERAVAAMIDGIVTATPSIAERFPPAKTVVVQNFPRVAAARARDDVPGIEARRYAFAYTDQQLPGVVLHQDVRVHGVRGPRRLFGLPVLAAHRRRRRLRHHRRPHGTGGCPQGRGGPLP